MVSKYYRRRVLKATGAGMAIAGIAGCQSSDDSNGGNGNTDGPTPSAASDVSDDLLSGQTIQLGGLLPAPDGFIIGKDMRDAAKLAVGVLNENGGILGADVELVTRDTAIAPATGRQKHRELTRNVGVDMTFGYYLENVILNSLQSMASTKTLHISTASSSIQVPELVSERYDEFKYYFQSQPTFNDLVGAQVDFLNNFLDETGWESAALYSEDLSLYDRYHDNLVSQLPEYVDVPVSQRTSASIANWRPLYDQAEEADVDVVLSNTALTGVAAVTQWHDQKRSFDLGGINVPAMDYRFWGDSNGAVENVWTMNFASPHVEVTPRARDLMDRFESKFGRPVSSYTAPETYDSILVYAKAVMETGSLEEEDLVPYLEQMTYSEGTFIAHPPGLQYTGSDATEAHKPVYTSMSETHTPFIQQWQQGDDYGRMEAIAPADIKTAEYQHPSWI